MSWATSKQLNDPRGAAEPMEWQALLQQSRGYIEISPWCIHSVKRLGGDLLHFFDGSYENGIMSKDHSFLIQSIKIFGLCSDLNDARFDLQIGYKLYWRGPSWLSQIRPGLCVDPCLAILPQQVYKAALRWPVDRPRFYGRKIELALIGKIARPIQ